MNNETKQALSKMKCAVDIKKGCMLSAVETQALLEAIASWTGTKAAL